MLLQKEMCFSRADRGNIDSTRFYYQNYSHEYFTFTKDADLGKTWSKATMNLKPGASILDLGSGSGRDLKYFASSGFDPTGIDYSEALCQMAIEYSGQKVVYGDIRRLPFEARSFDAVWAIGTLHHLSQDELILVLYKLKEIIKAGGYLFSAMKYGVGEGYDTWGRFFRYQDQEAWPTLLQSLGYNIVDVELTGDSLDRGASQPPTKWVEVIATC